jgi:ADP-heptose:LPS heptosyltransferase
MPAQAEDRDLAVIRLSSFGDIVLTEPTVRAVKKKFPRSRLHYITRSRYSEIPALFESVDSVVACEKAGSDDALGELAATARFRAVLDLQNNLRSRRVTRQLNADRVVRYRRPLVKRFLLVKMPWLWKGRLRHTVDLYADAARKLGVETVDRVPRIRVDRDSVLEAERIWSGGRRGPGGVRVAVCPGGSSEYKRWPEESFARLVAGLAAEGLEVMVIGSEDDRDVVKTVAAGRGGADAHPTAVTGNIPVLAGLLSLAAVTAANDSGLMHLAAAVGSKVVAIFGPTSPSLGFAPLGEGHRVVSLGLACSPCSYHGNRRCRLGRRVCMEELTPAEVGSAVRESLAEVAAGG